MSKFRRRLLFIALPAAIAVAIGATTAMPYLRAWLYLRADAREFPTEPRATMPSLRLPLAPPGGDWMLEDSFPNLRLAAPTEAVFAPDDSVYVLERAGRVSRFANKQDTATKELLVDFSADVGLVEMEEGAVGLALHPQFGTDGEHGRSLFVYYTSNVDGQLRDKLVSYQLNAQHNGVIPDSRLVLIDQLDDVGDHNGGTLRFGKDGFLYVSLGDEGNCNCGNHQRIDKDLFSGILRIDVDRRGGEVSHEPRRQPQTGKTQGYFIPNDNPFVGTSNALEEFWSIGLRNPFRFAFDPETGKLFGGDVGHGRVESVFEATRGSNHRWSFFEGDQPFRWLDGPKPETRFGTETPPLFSYPHENMNLAVVGGSVYRGRALPKFSGRYIYGDNVSGRIWALDLETKQNEELLTVVDRRDAGIVSFVTDRAGELYVITMGNGATEGKIRRLVEADEHRSELPLQLSATGLIDALREENGDGAALKYAINLPMWHGRPDVQEEHWVVKVSNYTPIFSAHGPWTVEGGIVFVKHISVAGRKVETQVLVQTDSKGGYGMTYAWDPDGLDARLVEKAREEQIAGAPWHFQAPGECTSCHSPANGFTQAFNTRQLNVADQLLRLRGQGLFRSRSQLTKMKWGFGQPLQAYAERKALVEKLEDGPLIQKALLPEYPKLVGPDGTHSLTDRVASYLDVNCGACHQPGGSGGPAFSARYSEEQSIGSRVIGKRAERPIDGIDRLAVPGRPKDSLILHRLSSTTPGTQMPPIGVKVPDPRGVALVEQWLQSAE
jgi:glucose/arabinose dehydrogenase/mono/diheme cytochrome c family protein